MIRTLFAPGTANGIFHVFLLWSACCACSMTGWSFTASTRFRSTRTPLSVVRMANSNKDSDMQDTALGGLNPTKEKADDVLGNPFFVDEANDEPSPVLKKETRKPEPPTTQPPKSAADTKIPKSAPDTISPKSTPDSRTAQKLDQTTTSTGSDKSRVVPSRPAVDTEVFEYVDQTVEAAGKFVESLIVMPKAVEDSVKAVEDSVKETKETIEKTYKETKETVESIPGQVEKLSEDVVSFPGKVKAQIDETQREIEEKVNNVQKGIEKGVQTTKDVADAVKAIPSNARKTAEDVKQSVKETKEFVDQTVEDVKAIPDNVDRKVKEIKQSIDDTQAAIDKTIEDVKGIPAKVEAFKKSADEFRADVQDFFEKTTQSTKKGDDGFDDEVNEALKAADKSISASKKTKPPTRQWWQ